MQLLYQSILYIISCVKAAGPYPFIVLLMLAVIIFVSRKMSVRYNKPDREVKPHNEIGYIEKGEDWMDY